MYQLLKRVVISGQPGTGTTTLINELGQLYHLKPQQIIKIGDLFRQRSREKFGRDISGYYQRDLSEDLSIDNMQKSLLLDPNPQVLFILESRLGGFFAQDHPLTVTILLTADEKVRYKRVFERDKPKMSLAEYYRQIKQREIEDLKQWQRAYPQITSNLLENHALYDIHIDNSGLDIAQTVEKVNSKLLELGAVLEN